MSTYGISFVAVTSSVISLAVSTLTLRWQYGVLAAVVYVTFAACWFDVMDRIQIKNT
jgi:biotin transporter BioY